MIFYNNAEIYQVLLCVEGRNNELHLWQLLVHSYIWQGTWGIKRGGA